MSARAVLYALLGVVTAAAAVLSFAALRDLALVCGFSGRLAWLLPVVVDAGAGAGSLVWLGGRVAQPARVFARALALGLLSLSVAANALGHGLAAFALAPAWWVVVIVSAVAPAVLGAVVHLAVLVGRPAAVPDEPLPGLAERRSEAGDEHHSIRPSDDARPDGAVDGRSYSHAQDDPTPVDGPDRVAELIAAGAGRRRLSRELGVTEYEARRLLHRTRPAASTDPPIGDDRAALNGAHLHLTGDPA